MKKEEHLMNSKIVFAIIAIVVAIGMIVPSISGNIVFADKGGIPNKKIIAKSFNTLY